jgi:ribokinase
MQSKVFVLGNFVQACCWNVPRLPLLGETLVATGVHIEPGGKGLNVAVCLQRLGASVQTVIGCGADVAGAELLCLLEKEGMSTHHIHRFASASGWGSGWITAGGQNAIAVFPGANLLLGESHIALAKDEIEQSQLVYGQFETSISAVEAAFQIAHAKQITTVLNPSPWQMPSEDLRRTTNTVIVNETEAQELLDLSGVFEGTGLECARKIAPKLGAFWAKWPSAQCLVVTLGETGSLGFERNEQAGCWYANAAPVIAVDTVGAGDAFASGYCAARLAGENLSSAIRWGNLCGGHLASKAGVLGALPNSETLSKLLLDATAVSVERFSLGN